MSYIKVLLLSLALLVNAIMLIIFNYPPNTILEYFSVFFGGVLFIPSILLIFIIATKIGVANDLMD